MRRYTLAGMLTLAVIFRSVPSQAISVAIDQFTITQGATTIVNDTFSGAIPPPDGPNGANTYIVQGTIPSGAESGGLLQLDSANGALTANAPDTPRLTIVVENRALLNNSAVLTATGLFNLTIPTGPLFSAYGIRFSDNFPNATPAQPGQLVQLFVRFNQTTQQAEIAYILQDFVNHTIPVDFSTPLVLPNGGADQILFTLDEQVAGGSFLAGYEFYKNGLDTGFGGSFNGLALPNFSDPNGPEVRGQFFVAEAVPEPGAWLLLGVGLLGLSAVRWWGTI